MSRYAEGTSVTVERSRAEIERTLTRYGASAFMYVGEFDEPANPHLEPCLCGPDCDHPAGAYLPCGPFAEWTATLTEQENP